jgi:aminoglycoside/choline kinase family phosphotransferase
MTGSPALGDRERAAILQATAACWPEASVVELAPLAGDASMRRYVRVRSSGGLAPETCMAMLLPEGEAAARSEELSGDEELGAELPFVDVQRLFAGAGVAVPTIHWNDVVSGVLLIEDVGDRSLASAALEEIASGRRPSALLGEAVDLLAAIATVAKPAARESIAFCRRFDRALIASELAVVSAYGLAPGDRPRDPATDPEIGRALARLGDDLAAQPDVLMHRDYHAWNLHVDSRGRLRVIDFQDAMIGPALHDLASLCTDRDSDRFVTPDLESELVPRFAAALARRGGPRLDAERLERDYFTAVAFRVLRVIGRFRFLAVERGKTSYLRFLPAMSRQARRALEGRGDRELRDLLAARSELFA